MDAFFSNQGEYFFISLFLVGIITGFLNAMGGGGGLLMVPFMILSGFSPAMALGTARLAALGSWVITIKKFNQAGQVRWKELPFLATLAIVGGVIGTYLVIDIDEKYVYMIVGSAMMLIAPLMFFKKEFGIVAQEYSSQRKTLGYFIYFFVMIYGGFFGGGSSIMAVFTLVTFFGFRALESHATDIVAWIAMSIVSAAIFIYYDQVDYFHAVIILISMGIGGYAGAHLAIKKGDKWVKLSVCVLAFIMGIKLLFFS